MPFLMSWIIKHLRCLPRKTDSLNVKGKLEFGWFELAQDLWALRRERWDTHQCDDGPPSMKFHLVKRSVIIAEDLPQEVFAFTAALVLRRQKRCTVHTHRGEIEMLYALWGKRCLSLSHTPAMKHKYMSVKSKNFTCENTSKSHLLHQTVHVLLIF